MRKLSTTAQEYVLRSEWPRLMPVSKLLPTTWHIRSLTGAEVFRWRYTAQEERNDIGALSALQRGARHQSIDSDMIAAAVVKIDNWEVENSPADAPQYETTSDPKRVREIIDALEVVDREELARVVQNSAELSVGEPLRLRSVLIQSFGEAQAAPASAISPAAHASEQAITEPGAA